MSPVAERVIVAMDCTHERALELADLMAGKLAWAKVGMELFYAAGTPVVRDLKARGLHVFLDLKLHDIPNTVRQAARVLAGLGVDMLTIHAGGGPAMVAAARAGLDEGAEAAGLPAPKLLAVTVLTSMDDEALASVGVNRPAAEQAVLLARMAYASGADGVVCSAQESTAMRAALGEDALIVTPGIRPAGADAGDQARVVTPGAAIAAGSTHLVVGRPITRAADPLAALLSVESEVAEALS
ncbi:MAG: orotidine-5'-phosphate decarboxylase [Coriobacteriia bacterium]|nr:orotidine-5'-phosphate decarboxylase [Coriobacteriia bacterium]MBS5477806.1 orotidine-5'-phosphate decarboxylase [Coriobacteriia bacterium]